MKFYIITLIIIIITLTLTTAIIFYNVGYAQGSINELLNCNAQLQMINDVLTK